MRTRYGWANMTPPLNEHVDEQFQWWVLNKDTGEGWDHWRQHQIDVGAPDPGGVTPVQFQPFIACGNGVCAALSAGGALPPGTPPVGGAPGPQGFFEEVMAWMQDPGPKRIVKTVPNWIVALGLGLGIYVSKQKR